MGKGRNYTIKEHYVPVTYLKGFSEDGKQVLKYELEDISAGPRCVPIDSICYKKELYEVKDANGDYVELNLIENCLRGLEGHFSTYRARLLSKAIFDNIHTQCFFTNEEKLFWKVYIAIQMLRNPVVIKKAEQTISEMIALDSMGELAKYIAIAHCLPFKPDLQNREDSIFFRIVAALDRMHMRLGLDDQQRIITSENPVYAYSPNYDIDRVEQIIFPLSSNMVIDLCLDAGPGERNRIFIITDEYLKMLYWSVTYLAHDRIFAKRPIENKTLIHAISDARRDKKEDITSGLYMSIWKKQDP